VGIFDCLRIVTSQYKINTEYERYKIIDDFIKAFPEYKQGSVIQSDYCYNRSNDGIDFNKWIHIFKHSGRGKYIYLGENYPCDGEVIHYPKGNVSYECGIWKKGVYYPYNK
jgi:hypothetical protein